MTGRRVAATLLAGLLLGGQLLVLPAVAAPAAVGNPLATNLATTLPALRDQMSRWLAWGEDHPADVLLRLDEVTPRGNISTAQWASLRLTTQGLVAARSGLNDEVEAALQGLRRLERNRDDPLLTGNIALIQAQAADLRGAADQVGTLAARANRLFEQVCAQRPAPEPCDPRHRVIALRLLVSRALGQGNRVDAYALAERALASAEDAEDLDQQASLLAQMATISLDLGERDRAVRQMRQAERLARQLGTARALAHQAGAQALWSLTLGEAAPAQQAFAQALAYARRDGSARLVAYSLVNVSDGWARGNRPAEALAALEQALPVLRQHNDLHTLATLLHNRGLAHLGLGQLPAGRADLEEALSLWRSQGAKGMMEAALREHSEALARRGDTGAALALYHREQALREEIQASNREAVTQQLRERYRSEADQRELALLARENSLSASQLRTQALVRQVWLLAGVLMLLVGMAVVILLRLAREANQQLRRSEALLKVQNERDPLTGLANRRHLRDVMMSRAGQQPAFEGALLLLDIDHFKRINDGHGHGAGDAVLVELGRRLAHAVRDTDLVCRWGGEEFLVFAPELAGDALDALANRILSMVGDQPVELPDGLPLTVTASMGYASYPLAPFKVSPDWEQAVNLVDLALYTAKSGGRDRAVRLTEVQAGSLQDLVAVEHDFQQAHRDGRVTLAEHPRAPA